MGQVISVFELKKWVVSNMRVAKTLLKHRRLTKSDPKVLRQALDILPNAWLFAGTLLGAVREGNLIRWDGDIDIGCASNEIDDEVIARFVAAGFVVRKHYLLEDPRMAAYVPDYKGKTGKLILEKNSTKLEICCFSEGEPNQHLKCDVMYYGGGGPRFFILPRSFIYPLAKHRFQGSDVNIPADYEGQLGFIYGEGWRRPQRDWYLTAAHYLCRERTIVELGGDDGTEWSKWAGRRKISEEYGVDDFSDDINEPYFLPGQPVRLK